jgi:uncharacterized protein
MNTADGGSAIRDACLSDRVLQLIVMPTERCNFRCRYCFEDFQRGRMSPVVVGGLRKFLTLRAAGLGSLAIDWFGGEPLLAFDIVIDVQSHVRDLLRRYPRIELRASMTTNGYLLDRDLFSSLVGLGVSHYQIALDGSRSAHDTTRVTAGGAGTFDRIWANLESARESREEFEIVVRCQLNGRNRNAIDELTDLYASSFGNDDRFSLGFAPLSCAAEESEDTSTYLDPAEIQSTLDAAWTYAGSRGIRRRPAYAGPNVCFAAWGNSFIIRSDGSLSKCTVALSSPRNQVGRLLDDGRIEIDDEAMGGWMRGLWTGDETELGCPMVGYAEVSR